MKAATRTIVKIDPDKCDGCGLCVPSCAEGAIQIIDGKARLAADNLCDGLGACLGKCPRDAITVEDRPADEFDPQAVHEHLKAKEKLPDMPCGCPGTNMKMLKVAPNQHVQAPASKCPSQARQSMLGHWPVQLALLPVNGPMWNDADVLIAADCVSVACPEFQTRLLAGRTVAIACPKLDNIEPYVHKLAAIFGGNTVRSITVARMEVPCCGGITRAVMAALEMSGRDDLMANIVTVKIDGTIE